MRTARLAGEIRDAIETRYVSGGEPSSVLPSERQLASEFGVARATVRAALATLRSQQLIRSAPGSPAVVVDPRVTKAPRLTSFSEDAKARGWIPSSRVLAATEEVADVPTAHDLGISPGDRVYRVRRLRLADRSPMSVEEVRLPRALVPGLLSHDLTGSLYGVLATHFGVRVFRHDRTISAISVDAEHAELLDVPVGAATLYASQIGYDHSGRRIEVGRSLYRGDRFDFTTITFAARPSGPASPERRPSVPTRRPVRRNPTHSRQENPR